MAERRLDRMSWIEAHEAKQALKARDWPDAVAKLEVQFEAEYGGGFPACLKDLTPEQRLRRLRDLGFRVRERYTMDTAVSPDRWEDQEWARISGNIVVNLTDGWVSKECGA